MTDVESRVPPGAPVSEHLRGIARTAREGRLHVNWKRSSLLRPFRAFTDLLRRPGATLANDLSTLLPAARQLLLDHLDRDSRASGYASRGGRARAAGEDLEQRMRALIEGPYRGNVRAFLGDTEVLTAAYLCFFNELRPARAGDEDTDAELEAPAQERTS